MEYVAGGSLSSKIRKEGPLAMKQIKRFTRQLLQALQFLHENRIAHRDIKCANIFLTSSLNSIKLGDFGAFKEIGSVSVIGGLKGTPHWMAPEVIREQQTNEGWIKADVWSLGCSVLEMITGHSPWQNYSNPLTAMYQIVSSNAIPDIPEDAPEDVRELDSDLYKVESDTNSRILYRQKHSCDVVYSEIQMIVLIQHSY
jgi:serine/threonine protein kinase